jgi:hypothetical protein
MIWRHMRSSVHADTPHQEVIFLDETDPVSSPMKAKDVAEVRDSSYTRQALRAIAGDDLGWL